MSYLPNTPYAPTIPMLPPQLGLGGPAPMNPMAPMASLPMPGGPGFPNMAPPGAPQAGMTPGLPAGLGQDAFGPASGAPAAGSPQGTVFQHPSGGYADNNSNLSGGSFWSSWKGISTIAAGVAVAVYAGIAISKGKLNIFKSADSEAGTKGLHELTGDLKTAADKLVDEIKKAKETFFEGLTKENVDTKATDFKKIFNELKDKNLKSEVTEADYKVFTDLESAHSAHVDKIAEGVKADKALDDVRGSEEVKKLDEAITKAEGDYKAKLNPPPKPAAEGQENATAGEGEGTTASSAAAQPATGAAAQPATGAAAQPATGAAAQPATGAAAQPATGAAAQPATGAAAQPATGAAAQPATGQAPAAEQPGLLRKAGNTISSPFQRVWNWARGSTNQK